MINRIIDVNFGEISFSVIVVIVLIITNGNFSNLYKINKVMKTKFVIINGKLQYPISKKLVSERGILIVLSIIKVGNINEIKLIKDKVIQIQKIELNIFICFDKFLILLYYTHVNIL